MIDLPSQLRGMEVWVVGWGRMVGRGGAGWRVGVGGGGGWGVGFN